jgi:hypothetical protein
MRPTVTLSTAATVLAWAALAGSPATAAERALQVATVDARYDMPAPSSFASPQAPGRPVAQELSSASSGAERWPAGAVLFGFAFLMLARAARRVEPSRGRPLDAMRPQQRAEPPLAEPTPQRSAVAAPVVADRRCRAD